MKLFNIFLLMIFLVTVIDCLSIKCFQQCSSNDDCGGTCPECQAQPIPPNSNIKICGSSATKTNVNNGADELSSAVELHE